MRNSITSFLRKLVPEGRMFVCTNDKYQKDTAIWANHPCDSIERAAMLAHEKSLGKNVDVYFTPGVFDNTDPAKRAASRTTKFKCFFIDLDVGDEAGKYKSKKSAVELFNFFRKEYNFPAPTVVDSGGGYHLYWPLTEEISADEWLVVANAFKEGLNRADLKADPTVTSDRARVLRVPGTKNWKTDPPKKCVIVKDRDPISFAEFKEAVSRLPSVDIPVLTTTLQIPGVAPDLGVESNIKSTFEAFDFEAVVNKCSQLKSICDTGGPSEGLWFLGVAMAQHSSDPEASAIRVSEKHRDYTKSSALGKLRSVQNQGANAPSCERFKQVGDSSLCLNCPHYKRISTPAQLREDPPEEVLKLLVSNGLRNNLAARAAVDAPKPFYRTGSSVLMRFGEDEPATLIISGDFYPTHYTRDRTTNEHCTLWRLKTDRLDCDIKVSNALLADTKEMLKLLHINGVPINSQKQVLPYMSHYINQLNSKTDANTIISTVGWSEDHKEFNLGSVVYKSDGGSESHEMDKTLKGFVPGLDDKKGTLEGWTEMMQFYDVRDHEPHRFMVYAGFASPLYHMTGHDGVSIFASGKSGIGKTTTLLAVCSIWGDPKRLKQNGTKSGSTVKARNKILASFNNIPACFDDMSNLTSAQLSDFALNISQGRDTTTLTQKRTAGEVGTWSMISQISSNNNAYELMMRDSTVGGAETMRVFQISIEMSKVHTLDEANRFANVDLHSNYGHAGHVFIQYVVKNYDKVKADIHKTISKIDHVAKTGSAERFWVATIACSYVAGKIAIELGLLKWESLTKDILWAVSQIAVAKQQSMDSIADPVDILRGFINRNASTIVIISDPSANNRIGSRNITVAEHIPKGPVWGREVRGSRPEFYISKAEIRRYCGENNASFSAVESDLRRARVITNVNAQKTLGAGIDELPKGQTRCWVIDGTKL